MPYFLILPAVAGFIVLLLIGAVATYSMATRRHLTAYFIAAAVGTCGGFLLANVVLLMLVYGFLNVFEWESLPNWANVAGGITVGAGLFIGPFIATAVGVSVGILVSALLVLWRRKRRAI